MKQCECGCGQSITQSENRFLWGHNTRDMKHVFIKRSPRPPEIPLDLNNPDIRVIPLTLGLYAAVDAEDYDRLMKYDWSTQDTRGNIYAISNINKTSVPMHQFLMNPSEGMITVHLDTNGLNNKKGNLRNATQQQATWTRKPMRTWGGRPCSSRFKGVMMTGGGWTVGIKKDGLEYPQGTFANEIQAALAYDRMARELFGEFGFTNFDEDGNSNI